MVVYIILFTIVLVVVNIEYVNYTRKMIGLKKNNLSNIKNNDNTKSTYVCADVIESGKCNRAKSIIEGNSTKEDTLDCEYLKKRNKYICDFSEEEYTIFLDSDADKKKEDINKIDNESKQSEPSWGQIAFIITIFLIVIIIIFLYYERYGNVYILLAAIIASLIFIFVFFYIFNVSSAISSNLLKSELEKKSIENLQSICESRGLSSEGSKFDLINRILSDNN